MCALYQSGRLADTSPKIFGYSVATGQRAPWNLNHFRLGRWASAATPKQAPERSPLRLAIAARSDSDILLPASNAHVTSHPQHEQPRPSFRGRRRRQGLGGPNASEWTQPFDTRTNVCALPRGRASVVRNFERWLDADNPTLLPSELLAAALHQALTKSVVVAGRALFRRLFFQ